MIWVILFPGLFLVFVIISLIVDGDIDLSFGDFIKTLFGLALAGVGLALAIGVFLPTCWKSTETALKPFDDIPGKYYVVSIQNHNFVFDGTKAIEIGTYTEISDAKPVLISKILRFKSKKSYRFGFDLIPMDFETKIVVPPGSVFSPIKK